MTTPNELPGRSKTSPSAVSAHRPHPSQQRLLASPRRIATALLAGLAIVLLAVPAFAADKLVLIPDFALFGLFGTENRLGLLWIMIISFALLVFPLNALIFQPIFRSLDARADRIQGARERSEQLEREADSVLERYETAIREARTESEASRQAQLTGAREETATATAQARGEAESQIATARAELGRSLEDARAGLRANAEELATAAAEQVLGRAL